MAALAITGKSMNQPQQQMQIKATDEALRGQYSNAMQVTHTQQEVVLDFFNLLPPQGQLLSRIITSPAHAKQIVTALAENLKKYEQQFGAITAAPAPSSDFGFSTPVS